MTTPFMESSGDSQIRMDERETTPGSWKSLVRRYGLVIVAYVLITLVTVPFFMGDTIGYASYIVRHDFSDFGHYGWYLLGWLASELLMPLTRLFVGTSPMVNVTLTLVIINWLAGLMSVFLMRSLAFHVTKRQSAANIATLALIASLAFLDLTQSGCSYVPGMSLLLLGIQIMVKRGDEPQASPRAAIFAGLALAGAVAMWVTYIFSIPAALLAPLILYGFNKQRLRFAIQTAAAISLITVVLFGIGAYKQGVRSAAEFKEWVVRSSHGAHGMSGVARTVYGVGHSFIDMGNDGPMVKAYLAKDPYNKVSLLDLVRTSLWKLALFYIFLGAVVFNLLRSAEGRRVFALFAATAVPVAGFAILWQGGAIERYLLLYPVLFVALAYSLASNRSVRLFKYASLAFLALMAVSNVVMMAKPVQDQREQAVVTRIKDLRPLLKPQSLVATVNQQDEVWAFNWTFPFNPINASGSLNTIHIIEPLTDQVLSWRENFAEETSSVWEKGGDVWVSTRVFSPSPQREWNWVEGLDRNVSWKDINAFFGQIEMGDTAGGHDGFQLLLPSERNRSLLTKIAQQKTNQSGAITSSNASRTRDQ